MRALFIALAFALGLTAAGPPQRIVSLSPDLTEILYGVGAFPRVVGVTNYDTYPPEVTKITRVGQVYTPSFEAIAGLRPDLVIINNAQAPFLEDTLKQLGLTVLQTSNRSVEEIYASIAAIGRATGNQSQASQLVASTRDSLDRIGRRTAPLAKPGVVMIVNRTPGTLRDLVAATRGSFLAELVSIAGGTVGGEPAKTGYGKLSTEDLLAINPAVILDFVHGIEGVFAGDPLEAWKAMPELAAVRAKRVYGVNQDYVPHASQRIVQTAELFAKLIHPELR
jgi:iron complex transport system substrate-binding protein